MTDQGNGMAANGTDSARGDYLPTVAPPAGLENTLDDLQQVPERPEFPGFDIREQLIGILLNNNRQWLRQDVYPIVNSIMTVIDQRLGLDDQSLGLLPLSVEQFGYGAPPMGAIWEQPEITPALIAEAKNIAERHGLLTEEDDDGMVLAEAANPT